MLGVLCQKPEAETNTDILAYLQANKIDNCVVSHPEPDILEREVRRALESTAVSKANGCDGVSVQFSSVAQSCPTLCDPMNRSTPGLPVHHQLPEFTQTHAHRVSDAIQPSHPLSSLSPPAPNPSQHQSLFQ